MQGPQKELSGGEALTTNNRMELTAAIEALEALSRPCAVDLYTDSQYVRLGITAWIKGWKTRGWKTADRKPVKNAELWQRARRRAQRPRGDLALGPRPRDDALNNRVDKMAVAAMKPFRKRRGGKPG